LMTLLMALGKVEGANIRPLLGNIIRDFGWDNVQDLLPEANQGQAMPMQQFMQTQQQGGNPEAFRQATQTMGRK
jgi:hypothetical protein